MSATPPEVFGVMSRITKAPDNGGLLEACAILDEQRKRWEHDGQWAAREDSANWAWFDTRDGLRTRAKICQVTKELPREWKRACYPNPRDLWGSASPLANPVRIRTYELQRERRDGMPVYQET